MKTKLPIIPGIEYSSIREAGTCIICTFPFKEALADSQLTTILEHLRPGDEVSTPLPEADGALEVRRTISGYEKKLGRHGSYGTWSSVEAKDAIDWLVRGAAYAIRFAQPGYGGVVCFRVL